MQFLFKKGFGVRAVVLEPLVRKKALVPDPQEEQILQVRMSMMVHSARSIFVHGLVSDSGINRVLPWSEAQW